MFKIYMRAQKRARFHVISPFNASFYLPLQIKGIDIRFAASIQRFHYVMPFSVFKFKDHVCQEECSEAYPFEEEVNENEVLCANHMCG